MSFTRRIDIDLDHEAAVTATKAALQEQGFGILTEIDVRQTLKDKLDVDTDPQLILGACNPQLAHRALEIDRRVATLLPWSSGWKTAAPSSKRSTPRSSSTCPVHLTWAQSLTTLPDASTPPSRPSVACEGRTLLATAGMTL